jgi:hypothetical protein
LRGFLQNRIDAQAAKDLLDRDNLRSTSIYVSNLMRFGEEQEGIKREEQEIGIVEKEIR